MFLFEITRVILTAQTLSHRGRTIPLFSAHAYRVIPEAVEEFPCSLYALSHRVISTVVEGSPSERFVV